MLSLGQVRLVLFSPGNDDLGQLVLGALCEEIDGPETGNVFGSGVLDIAATNIASADFGGRAASSLGNLHFMAGSLREWRARHAEAMTGWDNWHWKKVEGLND